MFPWDYKTSELGDYSLNLSTGFIDFFAKLGWAYDLKTASKEIIEKRATRTGDGSRKAYNLPKYNDQNAYADDTQANSTLIWGWEDIDFNESEKKCVTIINRVLKK